VADFLSVEESANCHDRNCVDDRIEERIEDGLPMMTPDHSAEATRGDVEARRRIPRGVQLWLGGVILIGAVYGLLYGGGFVGQTVKRIQREHGLTIPASSTHPECKGDAWKVAFMDCGASSTFQMNRSDVAAFISQLKIRKACQGRSGAGHPQNPQYQVQAPWRGNEGADSYACDSPKGDELSVRIVPIDEVKVGVMLYTDWN
jgi:hypothetical protein